MPSELAILYGFLFFLAGGLYVVIAGIVLRRFWQARLWMTFMRGVNFFLFSLVCWTCTLGFLAPGPEIAIGWYQYLVMALLGTEVLNIAYMTVVIYGHLREHIGAIALFLAGVNCSMLLFPENLAVVLAPDLQAYYLVFSPTFYLTNLVFGIFHLINSAKANLMVLRRPDVTRKNKLKFIMFTAGISVVYGGFVAIILGAMIFHDGSLYGGLAGACIAGLGCTFYGLYSANSSVFHLPIRLYLLVVFSAGGEIFHEKWFSKRGSESAALLPPAAASIAGLVDAAFCQSHQVHRLSLQNRQILYEWQGSVGAMLVADHDSGVFRNSLRQLLMHVNHLPDDKNEFDARVERVFNYYPIEK